MTTTDRPSGRRGRAVLAWEYSALQRSLEAALRWPGKGLCVPHGALRSARPAPPDTYLTSLSLGGIRTWTFRVHRPTGLQPM